MITSSPSYFFFGLLLAVMVLAIFIFLPFLTPLVLAMALAVIFDPLHEWIAPHEREGGNTEEDRRAIQAEQDAEPDQTTQTDETERPFDADLAAGHRPVGGPGDLRINVAVDHVIIGAPRRAHGQGSDSDLHQQPDVWRMTGCGAGHRRPLPTGQHQQPGAGWTVKSSQLQPGANRYRRKSIHPVVRGSIGKGGEVCHGPSYDGSPLAGSRATGQFDHNTRHLGP